jgi:hypothetical protein
LGTVVKSGTSYSVKGSHNFNKSGKHTVTTTVTESDSSAPSVSASTFFVLTIVPDAASANGPAGAPVSVDSENLDAFFAFLDALVADALQSGKKKNDLWSLPASSA